MCFARSGKREREKNQSKFEWETGTKKTKTKNKQNRAKNSKEAAVFEVVFDDDVGDGVEDELDVGGVGGARKVRVDLLLVAPLVEALKLHLDVRRALLVRVRACSHRPNQTEKKKQFRTKKKRQHPRLLLPSFT